MNTAALLTASLGIQLVGVALAVYCAWKAQWKAAWLAVALALGLVAARSVTLLASRGPAAVSAEWVSLLAATFMVIGLSLMPALSDQWRHALDLTVATEAQARLQQERHFTEVALDSARILLLITDAAGRVQSASRAFEEATGWSASEVLNRPVWTLIASEHEAKLFESTLNDLGPESSPRGTVNHWLTKDGSQRLIEWAHAVLVGSTGKVEHIVSTGFDITERARAEVTLAETEPRYRLLLEQVPAVLWTTDKKLNFTTGIGAGLAHLGLKPGQLQMVGVSLYTYFQTDDDKEPNVAAHLKALAGTRVEWDTVWLGRDFHAIVEPLHDAHGEIIGTIGIALDIAERKQVEKSLRDSEEFLRISQQAGRCGSWEWNPSNNHVKWSTEMCRLHGIAPQEFGNSLDAALAYIHPDDVGIIHSGMRVLFERNQFPPNEFRIVRPDGEQRVVYGRGDIQRDEQGNITKIIGTVTDVTDHREMSLALRQSEERYRTLVDYAPEAIVVLDVDTGRFVDANDRACKFFGMEREELFKHGPVDLSPPRQPGRRPSREVAQEGIAAALAGVSQQFEWVHRDATGKDIDCEVFLVRLPSQSGNLVRGSIVDITARKQAQVEQARLAAIIEATSDFVGTADDSGHALYLNRAMREGLDVPEDADVLQSNIADYHPDWAARLVLDEALPIARRDGRWSGESAMKTRNGREIPVSQVVLAHKDANGSVRFFSTVARDVSERRQAEEQLRRFNLELEERVRQRTTQLEAANRELEAFSYSVSHDLRAPLRAITGFCNLLVRDHAAQLQGEAAHYLRRVAANAEQMGHLVDDLLSFSRLGRQALNRNEVEPEGIVRQILAEQEQALKDRRVQITVGVLPACRADPTLLKQVFANLIDNALKYSRPRDPAIVDIGSLHDCETAPVVYFVKDNGVGFNMRYADKLFGVFQRLHRAEEFEGTGVGLAIVERIIRRHGGRVWAEAALDQGATFYFVLEGENPDEQGDPHGRTTD
ncbi:MAG: PAS domain S-box protein [Gemmataceae bacterium]